MSLTIIVLLIGIAFALSNAYTSACKNEKDILSKNTSFSFTTDILSIYTTALIFGIIGCLGAGILWWLKNGSWLTISPELIIGKLSNNNAIKDFLLSETSWTGVQMIHTWYLQSNLSWSFLLTLIVIIIKAR